MVVSPIFPVFPVFPVARRRCPGQLGKFTRQQGDDPIGIRIPKTAIAVSVEDAIR